MGLQPFGRLVCDGVCWMFVICRQGYRMAVMVVMVKLHLPEFLHFLCSFRACTPSFLGCFSHIHHHHQPLRGEEHVLGCQVMVRSLAVLADIFMLMTFFIGGMNSILHEHEGICFQIPRRSWPSPIQTSQELFLQLFFHSFLFTSSFLYLGPFRSFNDFNLNSLHIDCAVRIC